MIKRKKVFLIPTELECYQEDDFIDSEFYIGGIMRSYPVLQLAANPQGWRTFMLRRNDPAFKVVSGQVLQRDQSTCQYCGFYAEEGQEIINMDQNYSRNSTLNLLTACPFCAQCGFLESLGKGSYGGATLIYLPEFDQSRLNGLCHALFQAIVNHTEEADSAQQCYRSLKSRAQVVEEQLGNGMSDPAVFGQLLVESGATFLPDTLVFDLRLLPIRTTFQSQVEGWTMGTSLMTAH